MDSKDKEEEKKKVAKAYEKYADQFTPKPKYFLNCVKAFVSGGIVCTIALLINNSLLGHGLEKEAAGNFVTIILICVAQLLTGIGVFDTIAKYAGAGVIVPITGFANSMVSPAIEYKKEGLVLGVGAKLFSLAGPVLVCGISTATIIGLIYWVKDSFF
ncbi:MAG: stage V sporulation protein AC [Aminipila sp.]